MVKNMSARVTGFGDAVGNMVWAWTVPPSTAARSCSDEMIVGGIWQLCPAEIYLQPGSAPGNIATRSAVARRLY
jgi:hypothetical protein